MRLTVILLVVATSVLVTSSAFAGEFEVRLYKSELTTHQGVDRVYARIERAAKAACGYHRRQPLQSKLSARKCTAEMIEYAVNEVAHPALHARHAAETGDKRVVRN